MSAETARFLGSARMASLSETETNRLVLQVRKAQAAADTWVKTGDARRAHLLAYRNHFDNIDATLKRTLEHTWKIFGGIIARGSLMTLSRQHDEIRRWAAQLSLTGGH